LRNDGLKVKRDPRRKAIIKGNEDILSLEKYSIVTNNEEFPFTDKQKENILTKFLSKQSRKNLTEQEFRFAVIENERRKWFVKTPNRQETLALITRSMDYVFEKVSPKVVKVDDKIFCLGEYVDSINPEDGLLNSQIIKFDDSGLEPIAYIKLTDVNEIIMVLVSGIKKKEEGDVPTE